MAAPAVERVPGLAGAFQSARDSPARCSRDIAAVATHAPGGADPLLLSVRHA